MSGCGWVKYRNPTDYSTSQGAGLVLESQVAHELVVANGTFVCVVLAVALLAEGHVEAGHQEDVGLQPYIDRSVILYMLSTTNLQYSSDYYNP